MKIIDLLNKIANGEEVPKFWWNGCIHEIDKNDMIYDTYCNSCKLITIECLNDEIKLIEENTTDEIEELDKELDFNNMNFSEDIIIITNKINEIVREVNKLKKQKKEV